MRLQRHLIGLLISISSLDTMAQISPSENWYFEQLRIWAANPCGPGGACDTGAGLAAYPEVASTDPLYQDLSNLFSRGCSLSGEKPPKVPYGKLVWWDIDSDGTKDLVFAGGCSPEPYFVVLKAVGKQWHVWQGFRGRLLTIVRKDDLVFILAANDGYGVERDHVLSIRKCSPRKPGPCMELNFRWAGELRGFAAEGTVTPCTTIRDTGLRTSPQVDDAPTESGMGFDWPGNLYQELANGSTGWLLDKTNNQTGKQWSIAVFPSPQIAAKEDSPVKEITTPKIVHRVPMMGQSSKLELMVGWIKTNGVFTGDAQ